MGSRANLLAFTSQNIAKLSPRVTPAFYDALHTRTSFGWSLDYRANRRRIGFIHRSHAFRFRSRRHEIRLTRPRCSRRQYRRQHYQGAPRSSRSTQLAATGKIGHRHALSGAAAICHWGGRSRSRNVCERAGKSPRLGNRIPPATARRLAALRWNQSKRPGCHRTYSPAPRHDFQRLGACCTSACRRSRSQPGRASSNYASYDGRLCWRNVCNARNP